MIALIITVAFIGLLVLLLSLPISVDLSYDKDFVLKVRYLGITIIGNKKKKNTKKVTSKSDNNAKTQKDNFIIRTYKQKGLLGAINYFSDLLALLLKKFLRLLKHIKFRRFKLDVTVATSDAANTAIQYGKICAAVYPVISLLETATDLKCKSININADFDKTKSEFKTSISIKTKVFYLVVVLIGTLVEFLKLQRKESEKYERKQSKERN